MNNNKKPKWKLKKDSLSKCIIYFTDGNVRTFYSIDWKHSCSVSKDRQLGLNRLNKKLEEWKGKYKIALIYDLNTGQEIFRYT